MKELLVSLEKSNRPKYQVLAEGLRASIRQGRLRPSEGLPSTREMARQFKMNRHTVMNALAELISEGWIMAEEKRGYFVTSTLPDTYLRPKHGARKVLAVQKIDYRFARTLGIDDYAATPNCTFSFPSGFPDLRLFPRVEFKSHFQDALKSKSILSYGDPAGHDGLREEIATYLRRIRNIEDRTIVVTNGSQEAIFLLAQLLIKPGDAVGVEALGYPPAMEALRFAGAKLIPIAVDEEGLSVDDLQLKIKRHRIRFLYTTPLHQYPTTVTLSATRRLQLYELAAKNGMLILEDDYDHEFHYVSQPTAPLASFDPAGLVLYVSTFSKILFPSARVGFMAVPNEVGRQIAKLKRISSRQNEQILQDTICRWMVSGGFERHLRKMRRVYEERRNSILESLSTLSRPLEGRVKWTAPDGGMALWLDIGCDSKVFSESAKRHSLLVNPETAYRLDGRKGTHLRLGFSGHTPSENSKALTELFSLF